MNMLPEFPKEPLRGCIILHVVQEGCWLCIQRQCCTVKKLVPSFHLLFSSVQSSVVSDSLRPRDPQDSLSINQLLKFTQTHVHWVGDIIQTSHPLSSPFLLPSVFPSIRVFSNESVLIRWPKYWGFSFNISPSMCVLAIANIIFPVWSQVHSLDWTEKCAPGGSGLAVSPCCPAMPIHPGHSTIGCRTPPVCQSHFIWSKEIEQIARPALSRWG